MKFWLYLCLTLYLGACSKDSGFQALQRQPSPRVGLSALGNFVVDEWGQRSPGCFADKDWFEFREESPFNNLDLDPLLQNISLQSSTVPENCYRVGSEIYIYGDLPEKRLHGKAIVTKIVKVGASVEVFYDVTSIYRRLKLVEDGQRTPNCSPQFYDYRYFYLYQDQVDTKFALMKEGKVTVDIRSGARNCFRVGKLMDILIREEKNKKKTHGQVQVKAVEVLHLFDLDNELVAKTGMDSIELFLQLLGTADRDGGYVSVVHYEYVTEVKNPVAPPL